MIKITYRRIRVVCQSAKPGEAYLDNAEEKSLYVFGIKVLTWQYRS